MSGYFIDQCLEELMKYVGLALAQNVCACFLLLLHFLRMPVADLRSPIWVHCSLLVGGLL